MPPDSPTLAFGAFRLQPGMRILHLENQPLSLGARAFDLLVKLAQHAGEVVSFAALRQAAWPGKVMDDANLRVHISKLRKVLAQGEGGNLVRSVPMQGYCLATEVRWLRRDSAAPTSEADELLGRADTVRSVWEKLSPGSLVTLVGVGGVGKSAVAGACLRHWADRTRGVGVATRAMDRETWDGTSELAAGVLLLDNCESQLGASRRLAEMFLEANPTSVLLATSRVPLGGAKEKLSWVSALDRVAGPGSDAAVDLFVKRARAIDDSFEYAPSQLGLLQGLCDRLDRLPLAIELAAAATPILTLEQMAERIENPFPWLIGGRATDHPRHRSMRANLAWSFARLNEAERRALRDVARHEGWLDLRLPSDDPAAGAMYGLIRKSMLLMRAVDGRTQYRVPFLTRAYAQLYA